MKGSSESGWGHVYASKPWLSLYSEGYPSEIRAAFDDALAIFQSAVRRNPFGDAIRYFDGSLTYRQLDALSDNGAAFFLQRGVRKGDRVGIVLQNVPQFVIATIAAWKVSAVAVPINPMNRPRELELLFRDSKPKIVICHAGSDSEGLRAHPEFSEIVFLTTSERSFQTRNDPRVFGIEKKIPDSRTEEFLAAISLTGQVPDIAISPEQPALIVYTSGTSGVPKGAVLTHS